MQMQKKNPNQNSPACLFDMGTEGHVLVQNFPRFLTVLLEFKVMASILSIWLDTMFLRFMEPSTTTGFIWIKKQKTKCFYFIFNYKPVTWFQSVTLQNESCCFRVLIGNRRFCHNSFVLFLPGNDQEFLVPSYFCILSALGSALCGMRWLRLRQTEGSPTARRGTQSQMCLFTKVPSQTRYRPPNWVNGVCFLFLLLKPATVSSWQQLQSVFTAAVDCKFN